jgi:hypothetical protein
LAERKQDGLLPGFKKLAPSIRDSREQDLPFIEGAVRFAGYFVYGLESPPGLDT